MIPDGIVRRRGEYIAALQQADQDWQNGKIELQKMEKLMEAAMADQLLSALRQGGGANPLP